MIIVRFFLIVILVISLANVWSQSGTSIYVEDIYCISNQNLKEFSTSLKQEMVNILAINQVKTNIKTSEYYIIPKLSIQNTNTTSSIKQLLIVDAQLSFNLVNIFTGSILNSTVLNLRGSGDDINIALINSIKRLRQNINIKEFAQNIIKSISDYEDIICNELKDCYSLILNSQVDKATDLLNSLSNTNCITQKLYLVKLINDFESNKKCEAYYNEGRIEFYKGNFENSVKSLVRVSKSCDDYYIKSEDLLSQIFTEKTIKTINQNEIDKLRLINERINNEQQMKLNLKEKEMSNKLESLKEVDNIFQLGYKFLDELK